MRLASPKGNLGNARWSIEPPILLAAPFALLAIVSLCAKPPLVSTRWVGSISLIGLCLGSIAAGVRYRKAHESADPSEPRGPESRHVREIATIPMPRLGQPLLLSGNCHEGQLRIALTFAGIAIAAVSLVAFLLAGQIERAGPVSTFSIILSLLLIVAPTAIGLHFAVQRVSVKLTPTQVHLVQRRGLFCREYSAWPISDIQAVRLMGSACGSLVCVVVEGRSRPLSVPLWGLAIEQARDTLAHAGYP